VRGYETTSFHQLMDLEPRRPDTFVGVGPAYPWGLVYGGQVVAQALRAAAATVSRSYRPHSLHAYFIRGGDADEPIRYEVDRLRDGRSFATRQVVAQQSVGPILNLSASFQVEEDAVDVAVTGPDPSYPPLDATPASPSWGPLLDRRFVPDLPAGREAAWLRLVDDLGDDPVLQACGLAYLSDDIPTDACRANHPQWPGRGVAEDPFLGASLDHALWFHRPLRADRWHLHDLRGLGLVGSRGLAVGNVFGPDGTHAATVVQEVLLRVRR